jgi:hypothetical protein
MAKHAITCKFKKVEVINSDLEVIVESNGQRFGTLTISKGTIDWRPARKWIGGKSEFQRRWSEFDRLMQGSH